MAFSDAERDVDRLGHPEPVDGLQDERKVQALLQLDDDRTIPMSFRKQIESKNDFF